MTFDTWPALAAASDSTPNGYGQNNTQPKGSPLWWIDRLYNKLVKRRGQLAVYDDYYEGRHPLAFASEKFRKAFGGLFDQFADNWCDLVVDAVAERLKPTGFRYGEDVKGDKDAWRIWQENQLDALARVGLTEALINGESSAIVWVDPADRSKAQITFEHARQVIVEYVPGSTTQRRAALKCWTDDDGVELVNLYLPDKIWKFKARRSGDTRLTVVGEPGSKWVEREDPLTNPLGLVPVIPLHNRPRLLQPARSEIHKVIPVQNGVNKLIADMLVASEFTSFRQRWVTGMDIPVDPETKQPIEAFRPAVDRLFHAEDKDTKFGEFNETNLDNFVKAIELLVQHIASQTRTPPHYFYLSGQFPSGESIKSAETGLVAKVHDKMLSFGESLEEVMRVAFLVLGDERGKVTDAETIWADPESRTEAEHIDATVKKRALGVPLRQLWEDMGYSPAQIERFQEMLAEEATWQLPASMTAEQIAVRG